MKVRNLFAFAVIFFAVKAFFDALAKSQVKLKTMVLKKDELQSFVAIKEFRGLQFSSDYDNKTIWQDLVSLKMYIDLGKESMEAVDVEQHDRVFETTKERKYSSYRISKEKLNEILSKYEQETKLVYFLLIPRKYGNDDTQASYDIVPADINKVPFPKRSLAGVNVNRTELAGVQDSDQPGLSNTTDEGYQVRRNYLMDSTESNTSLSYEVSGSLDPSPPARPMYI